MSSGRESSGYQVEALDADVCFLENDIEADGELDETGDGYNAPIDDGRETTFVGQCGFKVIDQVGEDASFSHAIYNAGDGNKQEKRRFVIPKIKRPDGQQVDTSYSSDEGKRDWRSKSELERSATRHNRYQGDKGREERERRDRERSRDEDPDRSWGSQERDQTRRNSRESRERRGDWEKLPSERDSQNGQQQYVARDSPAARPHQERRQSLFESFAAEGLISDERHVPFDNLVKQSVIKPAVLIKAEETSPHASSAAPLSRRDMPTTNESDKMKAEPVENEEEVLLEIPMGRDSLVFVRDYYPWQVRLYPVSKADMACSAFAQLWAIADSSSIVWSDHKDFGGVAEFLLKDRGSIQKFMRKMLWHQFSTDYLTTEITERDKSTSAVGQNGDETPLDAIVNQAVMKFHNTRARQLIKTYYPTPKGEVTERSVYVNNVGTGVSADLMKAVFPCALKISVAKAGKGASSALVETESEAAAVNYLVVYHQIRINGLDLVLSSLNSDWEGANAKFNNKSKAAQKTNTPGSKASPAGASSATKRPNTAKDSSAGPAAKRPNTAKVSSVSPAKPPPPSTRGGANLAGRGGANQTGRGGANQTGRGGDNQTGRGGANQTGRGGYNQTGRGGFSAPRGRDGPGGMARGGGGGMSRGGGGGMSRGGGMDRGGGGPRGRGSGPPMGLGRGALLPHPAMGGVSGGGGADGLLPYPPLPEPPHLPPLLALPSKPSSQGLREAGQMLNHDEQRRTAELQEIQQELQSQVQQTRASLARAARLAEQEAAEQEYGHHAGPSPRSRRPAEYPEEERQREPPRRGLLPLEGQSRREFDERMEHPPPAYGHSRPPPFEREDIPRDMARGPPRPRREEEYPDPRANAHAKPYLLEPPPPNQDEAYGQGELFDYNHHAPAPSRSERNPMPEERPGPNRRAPPPDHSRRGGYPEERGSRSNEGYNSYEEHSTRRPGPPAGRQRAYEEEPPRRDQPPPRYRDEYEQHY